MAAVAPLALQQSVVEARPLDIATSGAVAASIRALAARAGIASAADGAILSVYEALLDRLLAAGLASWIVDFAAVVCGDSGASSDDPAEAMLLSEEALAAWAARAAAGLERRLSALIAGSSGSGDDEAAAELAAVGAAADALLHVARAVGRGARAAAGAAAGLAARLGRVKQAARALSAIGVAPHAPPPGHPSRAVWQRAVAGRRAAAGGRLFLDDLLDAAGAASGAASGAAAPHSRPLSPTRAAGARATRASAATAAGAGADAYPWASPAAAVGELFGGAAADAADAAGAAGDDSAGAARLALLCYFLADGGWLRDGDGGDKDEDGDDGHDGLTAAAFARAFGVPRGRVSQWEAQQLLDRAAGAQHQQAQQQQQALLDRACGLLLASAGAATPFRVVEALAAAGRPAQALAVQRARGAAAAAGGGSGGSAGGEAGLHEARVLLSARLACGLLREAHAGVAAHCARVAPARERAAHRRALMGQLLGWAGGEGGEGGDDGAPASDAAAAAPLERLQRVAELPLSAEEEAVAAAWLEARAAAGAPGGDLLPLLLLQRGRALEALAAYARWRGGPGGAAAAAAPAGSPAAARAARLRALMAAAAAALPACLRGAALPAGAPGGAARRLLAGVGAPTADAASQAGALLLAPRGTEPPVFLAPVVAPGGSSGLPASGDAAAAEAAEAADAGGDGVETATPASQAAALLFAPSELGPSSAAQQAGPVAGGLLFGVPAAPSSASSWFAVGGAGAAPAPGSAAAGGGGATANAGGNATGGAGGGGGGGLLMSDDEFRTQLLGLPATSAGAAPTRRAARSSKRQRY